jgi:uncharacterized protein (TIGR02145 family)
MIDLDGLRKASMEIWSRASNLLVQHKDDMGTGRQLGHVKLSDDILPAGSLGSNGIACGLGHTHSQYSTWLNETAVTATTSTIQLENNAVSVVYNGSQSELTFDLAVNANACANLCVQITTDVACTIAVRINGGYASKTSGTVDTLGAHRSYQITCVGRAWTCVETEYIVIDSHVKIGDRSYRTVVMPDGNTWLAENLEYRDSNITFGGSTPTENGPECNYFDNNSDYATTDGLLYNYHAAKYLVDNADTIMPGWHIPTVDEWQTMLNSLPADKSHMYSLCATSGWYTSGNDTYGFSLRGSGIYWDGISPPDWFRKSLQTNLWTSTPTTGEHVPEYHAFKSMELYNNGSNSNMTVEDFKSRIVEFSIRLIKNR